MRSLLFFIVVTSLITSGCGWQLRGMQADKMSLPKIEVMSKDNYSPVTRSIREALQRRDSNVDTGTSYRLQILKEDVDKRAVTYNANGTPAQYEMTLNVTYAIQHFGATDVDLPRQTATHRIFDFDPRNVVAKAEEERALLQHMRQQLANRLIDEIGRHYNSLNNGTADDGSP